MLEFMMRQRQSPDEAMLKMMAAITTQIGQFAERKATESRLREMEKLKSELVANGSLASTSPSMPIRSASDPLPQGVMSPPVSPDEATVIVDWLDKPVDFNKLLKSIEKVSLATQKPIPHILHIDNDREARRIIATFLQEFATVEEADTLAIAREKITNEKFDLVLLDFLLPDGNGAELLALLAKQQLPVILFSAVELDQEYARYFHEAQAKPGLLSESLVAQLKSMRAFLR
jgi:CheY-like chemotaxis protein